jgi:hypothetical protein|tara:strand:- start:672 stop:890 length:219 start_codon:yes stop_codon:yes gene_type:complete
MWSASSDNSARVTLLSFGGGADNLISLVMSNNKTGWFMTRMSSKLEVVLKTIDEILLLILLNSENFFTWFTP